MIDGDTELTMLLPVVAVALTDPQGRVLMARRPAHSAHGGLWEFPGGKIEPGESPEAALVREAREELAITLDPADLTPIGFASSPLGARHLLLLLYRATRWGGDPTPLEASALSWVDPLNAATLPMPPADAQLIAAVVHQPDRTNPA